MTVAESALSKIIYALLILAVVVGVGSFFEPWTTEYEIKTVSRIACNELIKTKKFKYELPWEATFVRKTTAAGVTFRKGQYLFNAEPIQNLRLWRCHFKAAWRSSAPWVLLSALYPAMPPLEYIHRIDTEYDFNDSY